MKFSRETLENPETKKHIGWKSKYHQENSFWVKLILSTTPTVIRLFYLHEPSKNKYELKAPQRNTNKLKSVERQCTFPKNHQQLFEPHAQWYPWKIKGPEDLMHKRLETECGWQSIPANIKEARQHIITKDSLINSLSPY